MKLPDSQHHVLETGSSNVPQELTSVYAFIDDNLWALSLVSPLISHKTATVSLERQTTVMDMSICLSGSQCGDVLVRSLLGKSTTIILSIDREVNSVDNKMSTKLRPLS
jgi:hypothetical protein